MSEFINSSEIRREKLLELGLGMLMGKNNAEFVSHYEDIIEQATPRDVVYIVDGMVQTGKPMEELKNAVSKVINLMFIPLQQEDLSELERIPFIKIMIDENREMENRMKAIKYFVKSINIADIHEDQMAKLKSDMGERVRELKTFDCHYIRKENVLFPHLEKVWPDFRCLQVMWSLHDDARKSIDSLLHLLESESMSLKEFNRLVGELYFSVYPLIYRENNILFPVAMEEIDPAIWESMLQESREMGFAFIDPPQTIFDNSIAIEHELENSAPGLINLETGLMDLQQIIRVFNHLPVDITYVDENDEVRYFSNSKNRHFPRSKAIIGRKVQNCHPPESIDIVNQIVEACRKGTKDEASFWIQMKGRFILIQYFAVRDESNNYKGVLEVSQDVTEIRNLEGERRLLDW
jgi:PAS domain S-box-containing protein